MLSEIKDQKLHLHSILHVAEKESQTEEAFNDGICIFDTPALPVQGHGIFNREVSGGEISGQMGIPVALIVYCSLPASIR